MSGWALLMRKFPIMWPDGRSREFGTREEAGCPDWIPWEALDPHEAQALENHDQTLATLASRGGLDPLEAYAILTNRKWREVKGTPIRAAVVLLRNLVEVFNEADKSG